jgi:hypothetical protein
LYSRVKIMSRWLVAVLALWCLVSLAVFFRGAPCALAADAAEAEAQIQQARAAVLASYQAIRQAEGAGANVSALLATLNMAGAYLGNAELAYADGLYTESFSLADWTIRELEGLPEEAARLEIAAAEASATDFLVNVVGSAAATVIVIAGSFVLWRWLTRRREPGAAVAGQPGATGADA